MTLALVVVVRNLSSAMARKTEIHFLSKAIR